jgi:hypothetical protein
MIDDTNLDIVWCGSLLGGDTVRLDTVPAAKLRVYADLQAHPGSPLED